MSTSTFEIEFFLTQKRNRLYVELIDQNENFQSKAYSIEIRLKYQNLYNDIILKSF